MSPPLESTIRITLQEIGIAIDQIVHQQGDAFKVMEPIAVGHNIRVQRNELLSRAGYKTLLFFYNIKQVYALEPHEYEGIIALK